MKRTSASAMTAGDITALLGAASTSQPGVWRGATGGSKVGRVSSGRPDERYAGWLELVGALLEPPLTDFPVERLALELMSSVDATGISWSW